MHILYSSFFLLFFLFFLYFPLSYCFLGYEANPHSKCNTNQTASYSDFLTMTTASLGQCPKTKCLASGSTLHAAPPVRCWAAYSIICIHLLSIPCCKHGLDGWWSNSPTKDWRLSDSLHKLHGAQSNHRGMERPSEPSDLGKLLPQGHQVLHLPELLRWLSTLWPTHCHIFPHLFRQLVEIELQACKSCDHIWFQSVLQTKIVSPIRPTGCRGWALDQKCPTMQRWSES